MLPMIMVAVAGDSGDDGRRRSKKCIGSGLEQASAGKKEQRAREARDGEWCVSFGVGGVLN